MIGHTSPVNTGPWTFPDKDRMDRRLLEILSRKDELVTDFPAWMLSEKTISRFQGIKHKAVVEIAGRDSIAAALEAARTESLEAMLHTIAYTATEYGDWRTLLENIKFLEQRSRQPQVEVFPPVVMGSPTLWWKLCGRRLGEHFEQYGFYSPCVGCHLYLHAIRIPLAKKLDCPLLIAGSREFHDKRLKINQMGKVLDAYQDFAARFGVKLLYPIREVKSGRKVEKLLGKDWAEDGRQLQCVLSKNYEGVISDPISAQDKAIRYLEEYALNLAAEEIEKSLKEKS